MPTALLAIATSISNLYPYAFPYTGEWMVWLIRILYWIFVAVACIFVISLFYSLFHAHPFRINTIIPALVLPIFPCMICGVIASAIVESQPARQAKNMVVAGIAFQGLGFWIYIIVYAVNMCRFFTVGLQPAADRPGMFILVSPPSFTGLTLLDLAFGAKAKRPYIFVGDNSSEYLEFVATFMALFMIGLGIFNFCLAFVSVVAGFCTRQRIKFKVSWFAMIFANVGLVMDVQELGRAIDSKAVCIVGQVCGVTITIVWIILILLTLRAVYVQELLYPGKDEDIDTILPNVLEYYRHLEEEEKDEAERSKRKAEESDGKTTRELTSGGL